MEKILAACGNDSAACPRLLPKSGEELRRTAELWKKAGFRDRVVPNAEIACSGCTVDNACRYHVIRCTAERDISDCGKCEDYPCANILQCFETTRSFAENCRKVCTDEEYEMLKKAFFEKRENLEGAGQNRS